MKWLNIILLQWFCIRLTSHTERIVTHFDMTEVSLLRDGSYGIAGTPKYKVQQWYSLQYWILPLTGWRSNFVYLNSKPKFWQITKKKYL